MLFKKETETKMSSYMPVSFFFLHFRMLINRQVVLNTYRELNNSVSEIFCLSVNFQ